VTGTGAIIPLTTARDLIEEGRVQRNCVASYIDRVAVHRRLYLYRTVPPLERCTLSIRRRGSSWVLCELKGACNLPAADTTRRAVLEWLSDAQTTHRSTEHVEDESNGWGPDQDELTVADDALLPEHPDDEVPF
jgi:hypothetical protein